MKEFRFREILKPARGGRVISQDPEDIDVHSVDNLMVCVCGGGGKRREGEGIEGGGGV